MWNLKRNATIELTKQKETQSQRMNLWLSVHTAMSKMNNPHETLLNVMWQPGWEGSRGK